MKVENSVGKLGGMNPKHLLLLAVLSALTSGCLCVRITSLNIPQPIKSGTEPWITLDCVYEYSDSERNSLVVKWFHNSKSQPVYQWIPGNTPKELGILRGRLDLNYHATKDEFGVFRALRIREPGPELSGTYTCQVSSFEGEHERKQELVIYALAKDVGITYTKPDEDTVNVTCQAEGLFPKPDGQMLVHRGKITQQKPVAGVSTVVDVDEEGLYDIALSNVFQDKILFKETVFECVFTILDTYTARPVIKYYPDGEPITTPAPLRTTITSTREPLEPQAEESEAEDEDIEDTPQPSQSPAASPENVKAVEGPPKNDGAQGTEQSLLILVISTATLLLLSH